MTTSSMIRCEGVSYRQGFIEVSRDIHPGSINIEAWVVDASVDLSGLDTSRDSLSDSTVVANTELELSVAAARELVVLLQEAIQNVGQAS